MVGDAQACVIYFNYSGVTNPLFWPLCAHWVEYEPL